ncbi:hypothetical protein V1225_05860 [Emergencia sp. JLR.KK010]|uniref:hypothetical protein n=1 Tax=Emergencia sp. JLR.KK010 TaxID=3114296 RepID=UPI0030CF592D
MNEKLEKRLDDYFYGDYFEELEENEETKAACNECYLLLEPVQRINHKLFFEIDDAITAVGFEYERRGFKQGYQYALEMLGLAK